MRATNQTNRNLILITVMIIVIALFSIILSNNAGRPLGTAADEPTATSAEVVQSQEQPPQNNEVLASPLPIEEVAQTQPQTEPPPTIEQSIEEQVVTEVVTEIPTDIVTETPTEEPTDVVTEVPTEEITALASESSSSETLPTVQAIPPSPAFTLSATEAKPNEPITITNTTTGDVTTYSWDFGNGNTSSEQNPSAISFSQVGKYTIRLAVVGDGGSGEASQEIVIADDGNIVTALFSFAGNDGTNGGSVCFVNESVGTITSYTWDFGDGGSSNEASPCHVYGELGSYNVSLTVSDGAGASSSAVKVVPIIAGDAAPVAAYIADKTNIRINDTVRFTDRSSGAISTWAWDFGDGTSSSQRNPSHRYTTIGTYTVTLTVAGAGGSSSASTSTITVTEIPASTLTCDFSVGTVFEDTAVTLDGKVNTPPANTALTYSWTVRSVVVGTSEDLTYTFADRGSYSVAFTVTPEGGTPCTRTRTVNVTGNDGAVARFDRSPVSGATGTQVCFTDRTLGKPASWSWTFGDGGTSTAQSPCYTYNTAGSFTARLTVTAQDSTTSSATAKVDIYPPQSLSINMSATSGVAPVSVSLNAVFENIDTNTLVWTLPNGTNAYGANASYTFREAGIYSVTLQGSGKLGTNTATQTFTIGTRSDIRAAFTPSVWNGLAPIEICMTDQSEGEDINAWEWLVSNGLNTTEQNPCFTFTEAGEYTISLSVRNVYGLSAFASNKVQVYTVESGVVTRVPTLQPSATPTEVITDVATEEVTQEATDVATEEVTQEATEEVTDVATEEATEETPLLSEAEATPVLSESQNLTPSLDVFDPAISKLGYLPVGSNGLVGEALEWEVTVTNGPTLENDVIVKDTINTKQVISGAIIPLSNSCGATVVHTVTGNLVSTEIDNMAAGCVVRYKIPTTVVQSFVTTTNTVNLASGNSSATATITRPGPVPAVQIEGAGVGDNNKSGFAGTTACYNLSFTESTSIVNGLIGYGPYIILALPPDPPTFDFITSNATFLGQPLEVFGPNAIDVFGAGNDPISDESQSYGAAFAGGEVYALRYPVGSVPPGGIPLEANLCLDIDPFAPPFTQIPFITTPAYEFGDTATGANGPIINPAGNEVGSYTPILITLSKTPLIPEGERPPGPVWRYQYEIVSTLAPHSTVTGNTWSDNIDPRLSYYNSGGDVATATNTCGTAPTISTQPAHTTSGLFQASLATWTNSTDTPCTITINYWVYIRDILSETNSGTELDVIPNTVSEGFTYQGVGCGSAPIPCLTATANVSVENIVFQKSVTSPAGAVVPGNVVNYNIETQITEYNPTTGIVILDTVPDGMVFPANPSSNASNCQRGAATQTVPSGAFVTISGLGSGLGINNVAIPVTVSTSAGAPFTQTLTFDIFDAMGAITEIPGGSSVNIRYSGRVCQEYRSNLLTPFPSPVRAADSLPNSIVGNFTLRDGAIEDNVSQAEVIVDVITLQKATISTPANTIGFVHGEPVRYRLTMEIPSGDTRNIIFEDVLPFPVYATGDSDFGFLIGLGGSTTGACQNGTGTCTIWLPTGANGNLALSTAAGGGLYNQTGTCSTYPRPGTADTGNAGFSYDDERCGIEYGPNMSADLISAGIKPTRIEVNNTSNKISIFWGDVQTESTQTLEVDLIAAVIDQPFNDGLRLSNLARAISNNTFDPDALIADAISYITLSAPDIEVTKGTIASTNPSVVISPAVGAFPPATNGNMTNADAADNVTYRVTVENVGGAPAHQLVIKDDIPAGLTACGTPTVQRATGASLTAGVDYTGNFYTTGLVFANPLPSRLGGRPAATIFVDFVCTLTSAVSPGADGVLNTATAIWEALNEPNQSGDPTGTYNAVSDTARVTMTTPVLTKTANKTTATIGELITYTINVTLPGGTLDNLTFEDTLTSGLAFVDCTSVVATPINITSSAGAFGVGAASPMCNDGTTSGTNNPLVQAVTAENGRFITWDLGQVVNPGTLSNDPGTITITYTAVVLNQNAIQAASIVDNTVVMSWNETVSGAYRSLTATPPNITIVEPAPTLEKEQRRSTPSATTFGTGAITGNTDAGDTIEYRLTVNNPNTATGATAYNVVLSDPIPTGLTFSTIVSTTPTGTVTNCVASQAAGVVTVNIDAIAEGATCVVIFSATVNANVEARQTITNNITLAWTSQPATPINTTYNTLGVERTGNIADTGGATNDYRLTDTVNFTIANPTTNKVITATSESTTGATRHTAGVNDITIGETVTFQITYTFREGVTDGVSLVDTLPTGITMSVVSSRVVSIGADLTSTIPAFIVGQAGTVALPNVTWTAGTITNANTAPINVSDAKDQVVVEVVARVTDNVANEGRLNNTPDVNVTNRGRFTYLDFAGTSRNVDETEPIDIVEPELQNTKSTVTVMPIDANGAGSSVTFRVMVSHTANSTADAFNALVTDTLPPNMTFVALGTTSAGCGVVTAGGSATAPTFTFSTLALGSTCMIDFTASLGVGARPNSSYENTVNTRYDSQPTFVSGETRRKTTPNAQSTVTTSNPTITKTIVSTDLTETTSGNVNPGEFVTYDITVTLTEGTYANFVITDTVPATMTYSSATVQSIGGNSTNGATTGGNLNGSTLAVGSSCVNGTPVTCTFGTIVNTPDDTSDANDQVVVRVVLRTNNNATGTLTNTTNTRATRETHTVAGGTVTSTYTSPNAQRDVTVVQPNVGITKTANPLTGDAGDEITYTVVVTNTGTGPAYDLDILDALPNTFVQFVTGSITDTGTTAFTSSTFNSGLNRVEVKYAVLLPTQTGRFTYRVTLRNAVPASGQITNVANEDYNSRPDNNGLSYTGTDDAVVNVTPPTVSKTIRSSSFSETTDPNLAVGETVTYDITAYVPEGTTPVFRITDILPSSFQYISSRVDFIGANITGSILSVGNSGIESPTDTIAFDFSDLVNSPDGLQNDGDRVTVSVVARVIAADATNSGVPTATIKTNTARLQFNSGAPVETTRDVNIIEPNLLMTKAFSRSPVARGETLTMTLTLTNNGTATAYDLAMTDALPKFIINSVTVTSKPVTTTATNATTGTNLDVRFDRLAVGESITVEVSVTVIPTLLPATQNIINTATTDYDTISSVTGIPDNPSDRDKTTSAVDNVQIEPPLVTINKYDVPDTGTVAGGTMQYVIVVRNAGVPRIDATNVTVTDTLPKPPIASTGSVTITTTQGTCTPATLNLATQSSFSCNLGTLPHNNGAGSQAEITFTVPILASTANGTTFDNTARVTDDQGNDKTDTEPHTVVRQLDLSLVKTLVTTGNIYTGDTVTYSLVATNNGLSDATNLLIEDTLPAGLTLVSATPALECAASVAPNVSCSFASVLSGQTRTVTVTATVNAVNPATVTNNAKVSSTESGNNTTFFNETNTTNNTDAETFTVAPFGSIGDRVWQDLDADGVQDAGELGLVGLTVTLTGTDEFGNPVSANTVTGANGIYTFANLKKGTYRVVVTPPANSTQTYDLDGVATAHTANNVVLDLGENRTDVDFGYRGNARVGDRVWHDVDGDGVQDVGEVGIGGLTVTLTGNDTFGNPVSYTTTTGANGIYTFANLFASDATGYTVTVTPPAGTNPTYDLDGGVATPDSTTPNIVVNSGDNITTVDFGYRGTAALGNRVWLDTNPNGVQEVGESGISGVTVTLTGNDVYGNAITRTTTTIADGIYNFTDLLPSDAAGYIVTITPPAGVSATYDLDGLASPYTTRATLTAGQVRDDVDFGLSTVALISGNIWRDDNGNAVKAGAEPNLAGIRVDLLGVDELGNVVNITTTTDANGNYVFPNLNGGTYTVQVVPPAGMSNTYDNNTGNNNNTPVVLPSGGSRTNVNFGYRGLGSVGDRVWRDLDNDATQDVGEVGIAGLTVTLTGTDAFGNAVSLSTTTGANGIYNFANLAPSDATGYSVTVTTPPTGAVPTYDLDGNLTGASAHVANNVVVEPTGANLNRTDVDFGYVGQGTIGDTVWYDRNANSIQDGSEIGLSGLTVTLTGTDITGNAVSLTTTTDSNGNYLFTGLFTPNATGYRVTVTPPSGVVATFDADGIGTANTSSGVNFAVTNTVLTQDFGYRGTSSIGDRVWEDRDGDGTQDVGEAGIPNLSVTLTGVDALGNTVNFTTTTDTNGNYSFPNLIPSDATGYTVTVASPVGMVVTDDRDGNNDNTTTVVLPANTNITDADFGYQGTGSLGDRVWRDSNGDGIQDANLTLEPGLKLLTIELSGTDAFGNSVNYTTQTDVNGYYLFSNLPPSGAGGYTVTVITQPAGYTPTYDLNGIGTPHVTTATLAPAQNRRDVDFGYRGNGFIEGNIWRDDDSSGVKNGAEPDLSGITVTLTGGDEYGNPITLTAITDASGNYRFPDLPFGYYRVTVIPPTGSTNTYDLDGNRNSITDVFINTTVPSRSNVDFGYQSTAGIGDRVWEDRDGDGVQDASENGIVGVTVTLTGTDSTGNPVSRNATTDSNGNYFFPNVPASNGAGYTIAITPPAGMSNTYDLNGGNDATTIVNYPTQVTRLDVDFGLRGTASLGDTVWLDRDGNGAQNGGEVGLNGITVQLTGTDIFGNPINLTTVTANVAGNDGRYSFTNLPPSNTTGYTVTVLTPPALTTPSYNFDSDAGNTATPNNANTGIVITAGENEDEADFGYRPPFGSLAGNVWRDDDNNERKNGTEPTFPANIEVTLTGTDAYGFPVTLTTITDASGNYLFSNVPPSNSTGYTVAINTGSVANTAIFNGFSNTFDGLRNTDDTGKNNNIPAIVLSPNQNLTGYDFGYRGTATLGDRVWEDRDADGVQDGGENGFVGLTVTLSGTDSNGNGVSLTTTTGVNGIYGFQNLPPSDATGYTVTVTTPPTGVTSTYDYDASAPNLATPDSIATGIVLTAGQTQNNVDFGYRGTASLGDRVWIDIDNDGVQDSTEPGQNGITVTLTGTDSLGRAVNLTTITANVAGIDGVYSFTDLMPSSAAGYTVTIGGVPAALRVGSELDNGLQNRANPNGIATNVKLANGENRTDVDFGLIGNGSISGKAWRDDNGNTIDNNEPNLNGLKVSLFLGGVEIATTTTNAAGEYRFNNLPPGDYDVVIDRTDPANEKLDGFDQTYDNDGGFDSRINTITVNNNNIINQDFGYRGTGSIGNQVWEDTNLDGVLNGGEVGINGVTLYLTGTDQFGNPVSLTVVTAGNGDYLFEFLPRGTYRVEVELTTIPAGLDPTFDDDGLASPYITGNIVLDDVDPLTGDVETIDTIDFGFGIVPVVIAPSATGGTPGAPESTPLPSEVPFVLPNFSETAPTTSINACTTECTDFELYHTNRTGNWEIYRLGDYPGLPNANPNLTQGEGEGITDLAPSRSPNGQWIAFASNRDGNWEIYVAPTNGDTTQIRRVTYNTVAIDTNPVWGPNNQVVYESTRDGNWNLYMLDMITGNETRLTDDGGSDLHADWSPNGKQIAFQSDRSGLWQIYVFDLQTRALTSLSDTTGNDFEPQFNSTGDKVAFRSYRNDEMSAIYVMNADGSDVQQISDGRGEASNHTWAPTQDLIAYQSDLDGDLDLYVYSLSADATRQVTDNTIPDYAPSWKCGTGDLLFTSDIDGNPNIFMTNALPLTAVSIDVAQDAERLTDDEADDIYPLDAPSEEHASIEGELVGDDEFAADQTSFLDPETSVTVPDVDLERDAPWQSVVGCANKVCQTWNLYLSNPNAVWNIFRLDGPFNSVNLSNGANDDNAPSLSPDKRYVAFTSDRDGNPEIYVVPTMGGEVIRVTTNDATDRNPVWSQDGQYLVFESDRQDNFDIYRTDLTTGVTVRLTNSTGDDTNPFMSFGNGAVIFNSDRDGILQIYEIEFATGTERNLSDGTSNDSEPVYAFDGSDILFVSDRDGLTGLYIMNRDGDTITRISPQNATSRFGAWSPNSEYIAFQSDADGDFDIYVYEVASGLTRKMTENDVADVTPAWRCDGERLLFTSDVMGNPDIYYVNPLPMDAPSLNVMTDAERVTSNTDEDTFPLGATDELGSREDVR